MRIARSRTSGENLFDFFMAQSFRRFALPQNPGRFHSGDSVHFVARPFNGMHQIQDAFD
jgi:hypothetical protein